MKRAAVALATLVLVAFALFVARETREVVALAMAVDPRLGYAAFGALLLLYAVCAGVPVVMFLRLPRPLSPPADETDPAFPRHLERLAGRLARNPHLGGVRVDAGDRASVEAALARLHLRARDEMLRTAGVVFLTTAISQSGRLDALTVLIAQSRMVWRIAHLHAQRPALRDLLALYANVAVTVFAAESLEDLDLEEIVEPVLTPVVAGSALGAVPGFAGVATFVTQAVLEGAFNAFLTLRVGCVANRYCAALVRPERGALRRSATAEAAAMLPGVVMAGAERVSAAVWAAARRSTVGERASALTRTLARSAGAVRASNPFRWRRRAAEGGAGEPAG